MRVIACGGGEGAACLQVEACANHYASRLLSRIPLHCDGPTPSRVMPGSRSAGRQTGAEGKL